MGVVDATEPAAEGMSEPNCKTDNSAHCKIEANDRKLDGSREA